MELLTGKFRLTAWVYSLPKGADMIAQFVSLSRSNNVVVFSRLVSTMRDVNDEAGLAGLRKFMSKHSSLIRPIIQGFTLLSTLIVLLSKVPPGQLQASSIQPQAITHLTSIMSSAPIEIASTIQSASLNRAPSPHHDVNPSTAASTKIPVQIPDSISSSHPDSPPSSPSAVPLAPLPRRQALPPLPDLRFEQSYLASIGEGASWTTIAYVTTRDQVLLPLLQGTLWTLVLVGWKHYNRGVQLAGTSYGARLRRWWWGVNGWKIPSVKEKNGAVSAKEVEEVSG